jgi:hypothetical protein
LLKTRALLVAFLASVMPGAWAFGETAGSPADAPAYPARELPALGTGEKPAPPRWDRALPLGAQKVIDMGFRPAQPLRGRNHFFLRPAAKWH